MNFRVIELTEYETKSLKKEELAEEQAKMLYSSFQSQISVEPPTFMNDNSWRINSKGWVGYIPLDEIIHFSLLPKVPIRNLFGMLEYAYNLDFKVIEGLTQFESISELYDRLALILAKRILDRIKMGLYRSYVEENDSLPYIRGKVDMVMHLRNPERVTVPCNYEEHTPDLEENQILLWTLMRILESGICTDRSLPYVRKARRSLQGFATPCVFSWKKCMGRLYNRLNQDYEILHALCRFFLENMGPTQRLGNRHMLPILVDMDKLFEMFVLEWLKKHISERYTIKGQENVNFDMGQNISISIDITIENIHTGKTVFVLDTKYKAQDQPTASDIHQVVAYAEAKNCRNAILIYPAVLAKPISGLWGEYIHVKSLEFKLDDDLDKSGKIFLDNLMAVLENGRDDL